jgi:hypothetical protein
MPDVMAMLAEARIRDWQRRVAAGEVPADAEPLPLESWETTTLKDIVRLKRRARTLEDGPERKKLEAEAEMLRLHLMVAVERERPRLARILEAQIAAAVRAED